MKRVLILLSTYNGEKYIKEQLDSILRQKDVYVELLVRDDGSTDRTSVILSNYNRYNNFSWYQGENIGVGASFMELVKKCKYADYYAFADQDDIWLEDKLRRGIDILLKEDDSQPLLYASNQMLIDEAGNFIGKRYNFCPNLDFKNIVLNNELAGCTMIFNNTLVELLRNTCPEMSFFSVRIHDAWISIVASLYGKILWDNEAYIFYRQHEGNVVGAVEREWKKRIIGYMQFLFNKKNSNYRSKTAAELSRMDIPITKKEDMEFLKAISNANTILGFVKVFNWGIHNYSIVQTMKLTILAILKLL